MAPDFRCHRPSGFGRCRLPVWGVPQGQGSVAVRGSGSIAHAASCRRLASRRWKRASLLRARPACRGGTTGASGRALRLSSFMRWTTAHAIISELSMVLFLSFVAGTELVPAVVRWCAGFRVCTSQVRIGYIWLCAATAGSPPVRAPDSKSVIAATSAGVSDTAAEPRFSRMRAAWTDFGMTMVP